MPANPYPTGLSADGRLIFCPTCYPTLGMSGDRRHLGDFSRDFEYGNLIDLYDMYGNKVLNVERAVFPYTGTPMVQALYFRGGRPVKCGSCYFTFLNVLEPYPGLEVRFSPEYPPEQIPLWLLPVPRKVGVPE